MEKRKCIGIIAEFDPFHRGHAHLIAQAKAALPNAPAVCVMSGPFTQRGEAAIGGKYARAEMALRCGADLVVELPVQWAVSSAESFARGGVQILHALGITHLAFGSESGDLAALQAVAQALSSAAFPDALWPYLQQGLPFASARQKALEMLVGAETADCLTRPNNLLGIEYLRAMQTLAPEMSALTIPRVGVAHNAAGVNEGFASASQIRQWLLAGELERACGQMPAPAAELLRRAWQAGQCPAALAQNARGILTILRRMPPEDWRALPDCGEGLEHRLCRAAAESATLEQFWETVKSKRYAHARIRRLTLWAYLGLTCQTRWTEGAPYVRVLGLGAGGKDVLKQAKGLGRLPVLTKPAQVKRWDARCQEQFNIDASAQMLWGMCLPEVGRALNEWVMGPAVIKSLSS